MRRSQIVKPQVAAAIDRHRAAGREFEAGGVRSFVREQGDGESVVLTGKDGNKNDKGRIGVLNQTSFVLHDEVDDKVMVMKRVKAK